MRERSPGGLQGTLHRRGAPARSIARRERHRSWPASASASLAAWRRRRAAPAPDLAPRQPRRWPRGSPRPWRAHAASRADASPPPSQGLLATGRDHRSHLRRRTTPIYVAAKRSLGRLSGTAPRELGAVLANVAGDRRRRRAHRSRLQASVFLTLESNRHWWTTEPLLVEPRARQLRPERADRGSTTPGQGIQIQWLATFGEGNGYFLSGHENATCAAARRNHPARPATRGRASPGSTCSISTAARRRGRAASRRAPPCSCSRAPTQRFEAAGIPHRRPAGARHLPDRPAPRACGCRTAAGALYAEYSYAPRTASSTASSRRSSGIYDYTAITKDPLGLQLFEAGDAEARARSCPTYDTGAWSLYDQYGESDLNYHELLTEFLQHLCERTRKGPPLAPAAPVPPTTTPRRAPAGTDGEPRTAPPRERRPGEHADPRRSDLLHDRPALHRRPAHPAGDARCSRTHLKGGTRAGVQISLSKISHVRLTMRQGSRVVWTQQRDRRRRQAEAPVGHAGEGRDVHGHAHRDRPRRQLRDHHRHDRRQPSASAGGPRLDLGASERASSDPSREAQRAMSRLTQRMARDGRRAAPRRAGRGRPARDDVPALVRAAEPSDRKTGAIDSHRRSAPSATSRSWRPRLPRRRGRARDAVRARRGPRLPHARRRRHDRDGRRRLGGAADLLPRLQPACRATATRWGSSGASSSPSSPPAGSPTRAWRMRAAAKRPSRPPSTAAAPRGARRREPRRAAARRAARRSPAAAVTPAAQQRRRRPRPGARARRARPPTRSREQLSFEDAPDAPRAPPRAAAGS